MWLSPQTANANKLSVHIVSNQNFIVSKIGSVKLSSKLSLWFNLKLMRNIMVHCKLDQWLEILIGNHFEEFTSYIQTPCIYKK